MSHVEFKKYPCHLVIYFGVRGHHLMAMPSHQSGTICSIVGQSQMVLPARTSREEVSGRACVRDTIIW